MDDQLMFVDLDHTSPEFDAVYDVLSADIGPEFLEEREFLNNRLRVRDEGPKGPAEKILVQDGYSLHLIAARKAGKIIGAVYGHLISWTGSPGRGIGFVTYLAVRADERRRGTGTALVEELKERVNDDSLRATGRPIMGMVFEIEREGKEAVKGVVSKQGGAPLDISYFQPAVRNGYGPEPMRLWLVRYEPVPALAAETVDRIVRAMLVMEYVGPEMKGFDLSSMPYTAFLASIGGRTEIGFVRE